uniref:Syntabulin n=1 Tax=Canis lupus familiaris TaxID=9615 RepID=A0A8C0RTX9_CANLF
MGPLRETKKEQRVQHHEKEISRSRIPRLILRPHLPQQQHKVSPASESPFSEEESREFNASSSGRSARTISSNSFCSDDTGCPSSQSVSPVKTPSDTGNSPVGFCPGSDEDFSRKKCTIGMVGEGSIQSSRYKKEPKSGLVKPGSEADFSSSSSTGSISAPEVHMSAAGSKRSSLSRKESEIAELKSQLARMREDWIEEECHRVEAQLALKEARKEIKQLRQVIETMRSSLADKDKGIQKYFVDINIQNKKLESLLQSMEMAHSGSLRDELCLHFPCDSPEKSLRPSTPLGQMAEALALEEQGPEEGADGELLLAEATAQGSDLFDGVAAAAATRADALELLRSAPGAEVLALVPGAGRQEEGSAVAEQAVQTDVVPYSPAVSELIQHVLRLQEPWPSSPESPDESGADSPASFPESISAFMVDLTPRNPNSAILLSPVETPYDDEATAGPEAPAHRLMRELDFAGPAEAGAGAEAEARRDGGALLLAARGPAGGQYWSRSFLVDLLAVAAPVVPTVLWAFSTRRGGTDPVYNIGALLRGCCVVALHSLRRTAFHIKT